MWSPLARRFVPGPAVVCALLQYVQNTSSTGQGRSRSSGDGAPWRHYVTTHTGWTSPSILQLQNLVFGTTGEAPVLNQPISAPPPHDEDDVWLLLLLCGGRPARHHHGSKPSAK